jgi:hypothetical protein
MRTSTITCLALLAASGTPAFATGTDGSDATLPDGRFAAAQQVYGYLAKRVTKTTNKLVEGQHLGGINEVLMPEDNGDTDGGQRLYFDKDHAILDSTGNPRYPGLTGARYDATNKRGAQPYTYVLREDYDSVVNTHIVSAWAARHAIVQLTATPPNPWDTTNMLGRNPIPGGTPSLAELRYNATTKTAAWHAFWDGPQSVATIADGLQELKDAGIPVVFRPFAEFNSSKYYGPGPDGQTDPNQFIGLWNDVYNYYVNTRHLDNLIFCWEAWILGRNAATSAIGPWFPGKATVDLVASAYYFKGSSPPFDVNGNLALTGYDQTTHDALLAVAEGNDRPLGITQWGVNYVPGANCSAAGSADDALHFYQVDTGTNLQPRNTFMYFWVDNCAVENQGDGTGFVSNALVATSDDVVQVVALKSDQPTSPDGWVLEDTPGHDGGGSYQMQAGPLRTGDTAQKLGYRSILTFNTALPAGWAINSATLRIKRQSLNNGNNPFSLFGNEEVDIAPAGGFGGSLALGAQDWSVNANTDAVAVTTMSDPGGDNLWSTGTIPAASLPRINIAGITQMRIRFDTASNMNGWADFVNWYSGDTSTLNDGDRPQLVVTYSKTGN